jgi:DDE superfamily endonuclease
LLGVKFEASVLPNGVAIRCSRHYKGSVSDIAIFRKGLSIHKEMTQKRANETEGEDNGDLCKEHPGHWALLADKAYQGLAGNLRVLSPKKDPSGSVCTPEEQSNNKEISSDRIIVEMFFGRLTKLWGLYEKRFKWSLSCYYSFLKFAVAMTNIHILRFPLKDDDHQHYVQVETMIRDLGEEGQRKRKVANAKYRAKNKRRCQETRYAPNTRSEALMHEQDDSDDEGVDCRENTDDDFVRGDDGKVMDIDYDTDDDSDNDGNKHEDEEDDNGSFDE